MATTFNNAQTPTVYPTSHVGFDSITQQIEKKLVKRGFQFNIICVGTLYRLESEAWSTCI
jgi:septin 3/9/12